MADILARDFVSVKIDEDRMTGGKDTANALRAQAAQGGIPWFVFLDPSERVLFRGPAPEEAPEGTPGPLLRRDEAVLATADGPDGNVGCPMTPPERDWFLKSVHRARVTLTDDDMAALSAQLLTFARKEIGERADG